MGSKKLYEKNAVIFADKMLGLAARVEKDVALKDHAKLIEDAAYAMKCTPYNKLIRKKHLKLIDFAIQCYLDDAVLAFEAGHRNIFASSCVSLKGAVENHRLFGNRINTTKKLLQGLKKTNASLIKRFKDDLAERERILSALAELEENKGVFAEEIEKLQKRLDELNKYISAARSFPSLEEAFAKNAIESQQLDEYEIDRLVDSMTGMLDLTMTKEKKENK